MALVIVTPRSLAKPDHPALEPLRLAGHDIVIPSPGKTPTLDDLRPHLPHAAGWLAGVEPITREIIALAPNLRIIARNGVGVDNVDIDAARAHNVAVANTPGANARGVAELALGLIFALARKIPETSSSIKTGGWDRSQGVELQDRTLAIAGCGQIGKTLARMALGVGMRVVGYDLYPDPVFADEVEGFSYVDPDALLAKADVLSLHLPGGDKPFLGKESLEKLKPGCLVVNTARAGVVDVDAMLAALDDGKVGGYAVDAFDPEPPGVTPLTSHPKVICTAHIGGFTRESVMRAAMQAAEKIVAALAVKD